MAETISLLWPAGKPTSTWTISPETIRDLELRAIVQAMCSRATYQEAVQAVLFQLCHEKETICYRQVVLADLHANGALAEKLKQILPLLNELTQPSYHAVGRESLLQRVMSRARELEVLVEIVQQLREAFTAVSTPLQSVGLLALRDQVDALATDPQFQAMCKELPPLLSALRSHASITIGINLDEYLRPEAAVLLAANKERFTDSSLLDRLLGKGSEAGKGIAPLHKPPRLNPKSSSSARRPPQRMNPLMVPLFNDLANVLKKAAEPVADELQKYAQLNGRFLAQLRPEIIFYVQALNLIRDLEAAGLSLTYPEIVPMDERICRVKAAYNLQLAIHKRQRQAGAAGAVANDIELAENGRIAILTGPNQGGKTTYMQSIGLVQVLAQVGMPVPGEVAQISPVDAIYTHYPIEEQLELGTGRFGDEAQRIRAIFEKVTRQSLVLLNESLSTTSMGEGAYLARDIVRAFRQIGLRAVFTTHMHEVASAAEAINRETAGDSLVFSLVASKPDETRSAEQGYTYRVQPGPPLGRSYAENIANRYGISDQQLQSLLKERDLL